MRISKDEEKNQNQLLLPPHHEDKFQVFSSFFKPAPSAGFDF